MAAQTSARRSFSSRVLGLLEDAMENNARMNTVRRLQSLSDEKLAERGLTRDKIVQHVFAPYFYL